MTDLTSLLENIQTVVRESDDPLQAVQHIRAFLHTLSPQNEQPVDLVRWVPLEKVQANDYNPNAVAQIEMRLLYTSIAHDGFTQPVVTVYDEQQDRYIIVDGFHRFYVAKSSPDISERCHGLLPVVVIAKNINDRMASTVRHNRARGKHSVEGMSNMVFEMLHNGWSDAEICNELGMEAEELLRLKHITGFSKLFANADYKEAWIGRNQIVLKRRYAEKHPDEQMPQEVV